jgi:large subunit ribosomal protein L29
LKVDEIQALPSTELVKKLEEAHQELFNLRLRLATRQLKNHRQLPEVRKKIARIMTVLRQRELGVGAYGKDTQDANRTGS